MKLYFSYIAKHYIKSFIMILLAITLAATLIDYIKASSSLPTSFNQHILYLFYKWEFRVSLFYPLAIVFSTIITYMSFVKNNTFVSLLSFGYSKKQLFIPFITPAFIFYILILLLETGEFSYANEKAKSIRNKSENSRIVDNLFFKYNDSFVYVEQLNPIKKTIYNVTVFKLDNNSVMGTVTLKTAKYNGKFWIADEATITTKKYSKGRSIAGFNKYHVKNYKLLKGYKPKVIELIYEGKSISLIDAVNTYIVLKKQELNTSKIKATFYNKALLPLFAFVLMVIIFLKTSFYSRSINSELVWALSLGSTLVIWGLFYSLYMLGSSGTISPDIAMALPIALFLIYGIYIYITDTEKLV